MDLPRTTSEIESLHGCADCWKSVSGFYYPFAHCDARIFHVVNCAPLVAGQMLVGTFGKKYIGLHYQRYTLSNATEIISLVPFRANVCVTDDIRTRSRIDEFLRFIRLYRRVCTFFKLSSLLYVTFSLRRCANHSSEHQLLSIIRPSNSSEFNQENVTQTSQTFFPKKNIELHRHTCTPNSTSRLFPFLSTIFPFSFQDFFSGHKTTTRECQIPLQLGTLSRRMPWDHEQRQPMI